jgi:hypothetical protein
MRIAALRLTAAAIAAIMLATCSGVSLLNARVQQPESPQDLRQLLQRLVGLGPDPCDGTVGRHDPDVRKPAGDVLHLTASLVTEALNRADALHASSKNEASAALERVGQLSAEVNAGWPAENRFHFQLFDIQPIFVVRMGVGTIEQYAVFGKSENDSVAPRRVWHEAGSDEAWPVQEMRRWMDIYPLHRGPSGRARFLAHIRVAGCAGSLGVRYDAREWNPESGFLVQIIRQDGAFGLEQAANGGRPTANRPFSPIGKLRADGPAIELPYCFWSPIDYWDNPSLCALDTYDLSGDAIRFRSRAFNRPELVPIARALEHAQNRDYPATLAYCASPAIARRLVRDAPGITSASEPKVIRTGAGALKVVFDSARFDLVMRDGGWVIAAYRFD